MPSPPRRVAEPEEEAPSIQKTTPKPPELATGPEVLPTEMVTWVVAPTACLVTRGAQLPRR